MRILTNFLTWLTIYIWSRLLTVILEDELTYLPICLSGLSYKGLMTLAEQPNFPFDET